MKSRTAYVPGLGNVELTTVTLGIVRNAYAQATEAGDEPDATLFANYVISSMLLSPSLTPEEVDQLPEETVSALAELAAEQSGVQDHFADVSSGSPREKLFQAHHQWMRELGEQMVQALNQSLEPIFDHVQQIQQSLSSFTETTGSRLAEIGQNITVQNKQIQEALSQFASVSAPQFAGFELSLAKLGRFIERQMAEAQEASQLLSDPITKAGFWIPPSAPVGLITQLKSLTEDGTATPESIRAAIVLYYENDDFYALKEMVSDWSNNPYFRKRMHIINDAVTVHMAGQYTLSIPALLPLVEGILTSMIGPRRFPGTGRWVGDAIENMLDAFLSEVRKDAVLAYVTGYALYGEIPPAYRTPEKYPIWLEDKGLEGRQSLQRHAILHGLQFDYHSKENSLRAFLILDVLAHLQGPPKLQN